VAEGFDLFQLVLALLEKLLFEFRIVERQDVSFEGMVVVQYSGAAEFVLQGAVVM
jgi:hypothetical protein